MNDNEIEEYLSFQDEQFFEDFPKIIFEEGELKMDSDDEYELITESSFGTIRDRKSLKMKRQEQEEKVRQRAS